MANLIDELYFTDFRIIPNLNDETNLDILDEKIDRLEPQFLIEVFGYEFQKLMLADSSNPIYSKILTGTEFTAPDGRLYKWEGIKESIANYVYYYWYKERTPLTGGASFANPKLENANSVSPIDRPVYAFNKINDALEILAVFLSVNISDYPTLVFNNIEKINGFGI